MQYRRSNTKGATYFFTLVTHHRRKILCQPENVNLLREAFRIVFGLYQKQMRIFQLVGG